MRALLLSPAAETTASSRLCHTKWVAWAGLFSLSCLTEEKSSFGPGEQDLGTL